MHGVDTGGKQYIDIVKEYRLQSIHRDLEEVLNPENAARTIAIARGPDLGVGPWSEKGCKQLARQAADSFLEPAVATLQKIEVLVR